MNILVTGGGGFIGGALIKRLVNEGHNVASFSRQAYPEHQHLGIESIRGDLSDLDVVTKACRGRDAVFHTAAKVGIWGTHDDFYQSNVIGTENVIKACLSQDVHHLIFTSSASVIFGGNAIEGADESLPYPEQPQSSYTATKAMAEQCILKANSSRLKTISLRPHLVWGPGDNHIIPGIIARGRTGKLRRIGTTSPLVDTTYIDNAVSAHICALSAIDQNTEAAGRAYFISNAAPIVIWDFINDILNSAGISSIKRTIPVRLALTAAGATELLYKRMGIKKTPNLTRFTVKELTTAHWFNISAAKTRLGYAPTVSTREGMKRVSAWLLTCKTKQELF
ncbi:NAD-dependent epimerase/dehydratase family protein [bacterium]|nr:NAD-dependent epimerase/dehydratase family protein [bacterium]